jgi:tetratricopeptide (TPR) repeat protein
MNPNSYPAHDNLGAWFAMRGQYDSALKNLDQALKIKPDYKPAYLNRGLTYMAVNRNEDALKDFEKYLIYSPNDPDIYNLIGSCYRGMGKNQEALVPINKAIDIKSDPHFFLNRSYAYYGLKNIEAAKRDALTAKQGGLPIDSTYARSIGIQ